MKRTFIAVPVTASESLLLIISRLKEGLNRESIKWVEPENIHITIKFLGNTREDLIRPINEKLQLISEKFRKQTGIMESLGTFSNRGKPSVLYSKLSGLPVLGQMAATMDEELEGFGFIPEARAFKSHLTLARIKYIQNLNKYHDILKSYGNSEIQPVLIDRIIFFESILLPAGPIYKPLNIIPLRNE